MTNEIKKLKEDIAVLQEKLNKLEEIEKQPKMTLENEGEFSIVSYDGYVYYRLEYPTDVIWYRKSMVGRLEPIKDIKPKNELESRWLINDLKYQNDDEVEQDEKDNSKSMDEVVERLVKEHQAQKLWNILKDYGFADYTAENICHIVEDWLPKPQSSSGSQNLNTELLVDGFNHCLEQIKGMLR